MRDLGYHAGLVHVDSSEFSVPQRRNRVYFLFIRALGGRTAIMPEPWTFTADGPVQEALIIMGRLRSPTPLPLEWFIASDYVLGASGNAHRDLASVKWRDRHARFADDHDITPDDLRRAIGALPAASSSLTPRGIRALGLQCAFLLKRGIDIRRHHYIFQVDQNVDRMPSGDGVIPCITPRGSYWSTKAGRLLSGAELLALQGLSPVEKHDHGLASVSPSLLQDLAGNAFSLPVVSAAIIGVLAAWHDSVSQ